MSTTEKEVRRLLSLMWLLREELEALCSLRKRLWGDGLWYLRSGVKSEDFRAVNVAMDANMAQYRCISDMLYQLRRPDSGSLDRWQ